MGRRVETEEEFYSPMQSSPEIKEAIKTGAFPQPILATTPSSQRGYMN